MSFQADQLDELRAYCSELLSVTDGGVAYLLMKDMRLPEGCVPPICDGLLCPSPRDSYPSRLFFSQQIQSAYTRNWTGGTFHIAGRNWVAFSWNVTKPNPRLIDIVLSHFMGFTRAK